MAKGRDTDMTSGTIWKQIAAFSLPLMLGLLFQQLYNTVDTLVVGKFVNKQALAAVGCTGNIINVLVGFCAGLATGAGVVISQAYGSHDEGRLHRSVHTSIALTLILSVITTVLGVLLVQPMLRLMDTPEDVLESAGDYLRIYFFGISGTLIYNMGSGILRAVGDSRRPLYFLVISAVVNTVLDLLFVRSFGMGVKGVAWATVIAQALSAVLSLIVLTGCSAPYRIIWTKIRLYKDTLRQILLLGLPSAVQSAITSFSNVFVQGYINAFGSDCMAAWGVYNKLDAFVLLPMQAVSMCSATFVGQNWGAGQKKRAARGVTVSLAISVGTAVVLGALLLLLRAPVLSLFTDDPGVAEFSAYFISVITPFYVLCCFNQIYSGALRGIGSATLPTIVMLGSFVAFRQVFLYVTKLLNAGILAVTLAYPMGWIMCSTLLAFFYHRSALFRDKRRASARRKGTGSS